MNALWQNLRKKWLLALLMVLILLGGIIGLTVLIEYLRFRFREDPNAPPVSSAPAAPDPAEADQQASDEWPESFQPPLKIHFDIPEMPEQLLTPAEQDEEP